MSDECGFGLRSVNDRQLHRKPSVSGFCSRREFDHTEDKQVIVGRIGDAAVDVKQDTLLTDHTFVINLATWPLRSKRDLRSFKPVIALWELGVGFG